MERRTFLKQAALGAAGFSALPLMPLGCGGHSRPNIIFILADDLGYGDLGCYGQTRIRTPFIDTMAEEGMRFTQSYAGSTVCAPSRCTLMTGKHTGHGTIRDNKANMGIGAPKAMVRRVSLSDEDVTVAEVLHSAGYTTGLFGKWHMALPGTDGVPTRRGFDEFFGELSNPTGDAPPQPRYIWEGEEPAFAQPPYFLHDYVTDRALDFIDRHRGGPFFLYLAYKIPHANSGKLPDGSKIPHDPRYSDQDWPESAKHQATLITRMDRSIGRVFEHLKSLGIDENTVVFFTSDNGPHKEDGNDPHFFESNGPLKGIKRDFYEGGIRVPLIARWPGRIEAKTTNDHVCAFWDVMPTLAELGGAPAPEETDGISYVDALMGKKQASHPYLYWEIYQGGFRQAVRMGDWKAVRFTSKGLPTELYDLRQDIGEDRNIAGEHPDVIGEIERIFSEAHTASGNYPKSREELNSVAGSDLDR